MDSRSKWRKILYKSQPYPDNFVDGSFLQLLEKNRHIRNHSLSQIFGKAGLISQQISSVFIFVAMFAYMQRKFLSPYLLIGISSTLTVGGYIIVVMDSNTSPAGRMNRTHVDDVRCSLLLAGFLFGFSSILRTLTYTICSDTIYSIANRKFLRHILRHMKLLANLFKHDTLQTISERDLQHMQLDVLMFVCHLVFHDYGYDQADTVYSSVFASVCLASRLPTLEHTFATILFGFQIFSLLPVFRSKYQKKHDSRRKLLTSLTFVVCLICLCAIKIDYALLFLILQFCIMVLCPLWLHRLQAFKDNIHGPWDEAIIVE
ncbi:Phosphatidylinositol N-acetylglucosaminyltransferase subunit C [Trichoplax sp. H2]|nr:Phosphatidylinositol N-acetylglucosaminyltransferase subunit C [Trichoplax sp. H2]|eukprot:RDD44419.1 Phosphatidylinositol N-acetylglucosaminyltransferase subunit C [Trichoplax sp. H2]